MLSALSIRSPATAQSELLLLLLLMLMLRLTSSLYCAARFSCPFSRVFRFFVFRFFGMFSGCMDGSVL
jgi:hypothetical protein